MLKTGNGKQAIASLFVSGGTVDIVIEKTTKNSVKLVYCNEHFTINAHGVLCAETKLSNGKTWYSFCPSRFPGKDIKESVRQWLQSNKHNYRFEYKL